jgi:hypothetical protein
MPLETNRRDSIADLEPRDPRPDRYDLPTGV